MLVVFLKLLTGGDDFSIVLSDSDKKSFRIDYYLNASGISDIERDELATQQRGKFKSDKIAENFTGELCFLPIVSATARKMQDKSFETICFRSRQRNKLQHIIAFTFFCDLFTHRPCLNIFHLSILHSLLSIAPKCGTRGC